MMKAHWWSCVLGLLCMSAEVILHNRNVSQNPSTIIIKTVNSSIDIACSTTLRNTQGLRLQRRFHSNSEETDVMYLALRKGKVIQTTKAAEFEGRIQANQQTQSGEGYGFTLTLSLLRLDDTDLYYCSWNHMDSQTYDTQTHSSNGTVVIIKEKDPGEQCTDYILDVILIGLSVTAIPFVLFLYVGALVLTCKQFKKKFRTGNTSRPDSPQHVCPPQRFQPYSYLTTSENTIDFRGIC